MLIGTGGLTFTNITDIEFQSKSSSIFIQSDKAIYKPGQTGESRAYTPYSSNQIRPSISRAKLEGHVHALHI
jgi:hypothetical protein